MLARSLRRVYAFGPFVRGQRENIPRARQRACGGVPLEASSLQTAHRAPSVGRDALAFGKRTLTHEDADTAASVQQVCNQARG